MCKYLIPKPNPADLVHVLITEMLIEGEDHRQKIKLVITTLEMHGWITEQNRDELNRRLEKTYIHEKGD